MLGIDEIRTRNCSTIEREVDRVISEYRDGERPLRLIRFGISGYDNDPRALFDIPEVRSWCGALYQKLPFVFSILDTATIDWVFPAVAEIEVISRKVGNVQFTYRPSSHALLAEIERVGRIFFNQLTKSEMEIERAGRRFFSHLTKSDPETDNLFQESMRRIMTGIGM